MNENAWTDVRGHLEACAAVLDENRYIALSHLVLARRGMEAVLALLAAAAGLDERAETDARAAADELNTLARRLAQAFAQAHE